MRRTSAAPRECAMTIARACSLRGGCSRFCRPPQRSFATARRASGVDELRAERRDPHSARSSADRDASRSRASAGQARDRRLSHRDRRAAPGHRPPARADRGARQPGRAVRQAREGPLHRSRHAAAQVRAGAREQQRSAEDEARRRAEEAKAPNSPRTKRDYEAALNQFKLGNYPVRDRSSSRLHCHLSASSKLAPSAQYWIGNSHYALRDYK